jgi:hypothetical protein
MKSLIDGLPPEIAQRIHPDWRKNERDYWEHRDKLLPQYRDQWIGFANGDVIASGTSPVEVFHAAQASGQHPFVACVGHEHEPCRIRRAVFSYDTTYPSEALPVITVEFRKHEDSAGLIMERVILSPTPLSCRDAYVNSVAARRTILFDPRPSASRELQQKPELPMDRTPSRLTWR